MGAELVQTQFLGRRACGQRFTIEVQIGVPRPISDGRVWVCPLAVLPLVPGLTGIEGADPLQALCLACAAAIRVLQDFGEAGGAVLHADGSPCPLDAYLLQPLG